ncbi:MAG: MarR family transcriptional regulator [Firmicutes bacterium]|nr:MarR family transcriptional regulator [Bacillota bacterium]
MESTSRDTTQKLMDAFARFRRLHRDSPIPGLKHSEMRILFRIRKNMAVHGCGARISEISHMMHVTSPTVTQLVNGLAKSGYVERTIDPKDRRSIRVTLTKQGEDVLKSAADAFFSEFNGLVTHLGEEKSNTLIELLTESFDYLREATPIFIAGEQE